MEIYSDFAHFNRPGSLIHSCLTFSCASVLCFISHVVFPTPPEGEKLNRIDNKADSRNYDNDHIDEIICVSYFDALLQPPCISSLLYRAQFSMLNDLYLRAHMAHRARATIP